MATLELSNSFSVSSTAGYKVGTTTTTSALGAGKGSYGIAHEKIATITNDILKNTVFGVNVVQAYPSNGTAAVGGAMTFTFDASASTISGTPDGKTITLTSADGEVRTYTIRERVAAVKADALVLTGFTTGTDRIGLTVPTDSGGAGVIINIQLCADTNGSTSAGSGVIGVGTTGASASTVAEAVRDAINGTANGRVHFGSGISASGVAGLTAAIGTSGEKVSLTATNAGASGNDIVVANTAGDAAAAGNLAGGSGPNTQTKNEFSAGTTATLTAVNFKAAVDESVHGHGTSRFTTTINSSAGVVVVTNVTTGTAGNKAISVSGWDDICSVNAPSNFSAGAAALTPNITVQLSTDGTNWTSEGIAVASDAKLTTTGLHLFSVDLTSVVAPYARIVINENNVNLGDTSSTGTHQAVYTTKL